MKHTYVGCYKIKEIIKPYKENEKKIIWVDTKFKYFQMSWHKCQSKINTWNQIMVKTKANENGTQQKKESPTTK